MTTAEVIRRFRRELAEDGADPFEIAATALARNAELQQRIEQLERMLRA